MPIEHMDMKHPKIIVAGIGPGNESDNLDTVYSLVNHNYGVAFLPSTLLPVLTKKDSNVRFYPLASKNAQRRIGIAYLGTRFKEKKMQALAKEIRNRLLGAQILPS